MLHCVSGTIEIMSVEYVRTTHEHTKRGACLQQLAIPGNTWVPKFSCWITLLENDDALKDVQNHI